MLRAIGAPRRVDSPVRRPTPEVFMRLAALVGLLPALCLSSIVMAAEDRGEVARAVASGPSFTALPRWEVGVGGGYFSGHDYPASNDPNQRALALPYLIYRSSVFRVGGGGIRAVAVERPRIRLDVSLGASLSARSEGNGLRAGMPDLDFLLELGPQLEISLLDREMASGGRLQLEFATELRAVVATDFQEIHSQGFVAELSVSGARRRIAGSGVDLLASLGITYADERLQAYFYEVDARYARQGRPAYGASGGYLGSELFIGAALRPNRSLRVFLGMQSGLYAGAANRDSPLFETTSSTGIAAGFAWTVARSKRLIDVIEVD